MKKDTIFRAIIVIVLAFLIYLFGIKPFVTGDVFFDRDKSKLKWARDSLAESRDTYDVIVYGEEPEGISAALSAARLGARTLIISNGNDLGGMIKNCLIPDLDISKGSNQRILNGGILAEFNHKLGKGFSSEKYLKIVNEFVKNEKSLDVIYGAKLISVKNDGESVKSINIEAGGEQINCKGQVFIDGSQQGELLAACKVPFFKGSGDLNLENSYMPVRLNFGMTGEKAFLITSLINKDSGALLKEIRKFVPSDLRTRINNFNIVSTGSGTIIVQGIEISGIDADNKVQLDEAYKVAVKEAQELSSFLTNKFSEFKNWKFSNAADSLYIPEYRHFNGLYVLGVNDILENRYFDNTIAMGSKPVDGGKLIDGNVKIIGMPVQYGIPLGCIIAQPLNNLLMTGAKASYSSLAATSAGSTGTSIATGEAAGLVAVYSILKGVAPSSLETLKKLDYYVEIQKYLKKQSYYIPELKLENLNDSNWSYPAARQLLSLGLIAGGTANDLGFDRKATQSDLAVLLLNGIYRVSPEKYSIELDSRLRTYFVNDPLTRESAGAIIASLYDIKGNDLYSIVCSKGFINEIMQLRLKDRDRLNMDDVYYLATYNIRGFTGKNIKD